MNNYEVETDEYLAHGLKLFFQSSAKMQKWHSDDCQGYGDSYLTVLVKV